MDEELLFNVASRFRSACEKYRNEHDDPFASMKYFPRGCCTLASEALLRYLHDEGIYGAELLNYITSPRNMTFHDLVFVHGWTVDITADQFPKEHRTVIVRKVDELPKAWKLSQRFTLDQLIKAHSDKGATTLLEMYQGIRTFLLSSTHETKA